MQFKPTEEISAFLETIAAPMGIEIVEVEVKPKEPSITVYIDVEKEGGVDLDTCALFHNAIDEPLDEFDPSFGAAYTLNVSSPGLDRAFKTPRDFNKNLGKKVEIKLYAPMKGKKLLEGTMVAWNENSVTIEDAKKTTLAIERNKIAKINRAIEFLD
ncbi:MAG: ribosome maturation factor RimP [Clostridia bacterium]|nr:ribosome maturation factor RimP [Clostridia bacterium]